MVLCKECNNKTILATAFVTYFGPDEEPYESGIQEKCGYEDGIDAEVSIGIHWCPKCKEIVDVWIEEPMKKDVRDQQLQAENKQLREALQEASTDFYYIHQHPEDAHSDSYKFMNKTEQALKGVTDGKNTNT